MTRHDIRLRRERFGSKRILRHKNYNELLSRHRKSLRFRTLRLVVILLILIILIGFSYFFLIKIEKTDNTPKKPPVSLIETHE